MSFEKLVEVMDFGVTKMQGIQLCLIQHSVLGHAARETQRDLDEQGIKVIYWSPFSLNLNPIKRVWHIVKNYLQGHLLDTISYDKLRIVVTDA